MAYFIIFIISSCLVGLAEASLRKKFLIPITICLLIAAAVILSVFGAIRADSVGTDTATYNRYFMVAVNSANFQSFHYDFKHIDQSEFGFTVLNYVVSRFTSSPNGFEFICGLVINLNVVHAIFLMRKRISMTIAWLTFCCMFYGTSIDILRQSIALSFVLLAVAYMFNNMDWRAACMILLAISLHTSAIISVLIFFTGFLFQRVTNVKGRLFVNVMVVVVTCILPILIQLISYFGLYTDKYNGYLSQGGQFSLLATILVRLPMLLMVLWSFIVCRKYLNRMTGWIYVLLIQESLMIPLYLISPVVGRLMLYFGITKVIGYPLALANSGIRFRVIKGFMYLVYVLMIVGIFYNQIIVNNNGEVFPYVVNSNFLN